MKTQRDSQEEALRRKTLLIFGTAVGLLALGGLFLGLLVASLTNINVHFSILLLLLLAAIAASGMLMTRLRRILEKWEKQASERSKRIETVVALSQRLSAILDLNALMQEVVNLITETFNYYHAHIFLLDKERGLLVVVEGYGEAGVEMKRRNHSIALAAPQSLVARSAREGRIVNVGNVRDDPNWLPNPSLPETRAEMAVPVMLGGEVLGILDVQSENAYNFTDEDETILQALANQVAIATHNTRLFAQIQAAQHQLEQTVNDYVVFVEQVAKGDLTVRLALNGDNAALTVLGSNLNSMVERLGEMADQIRMATTNITTAASEILAATTQQAAGASEQSAAVSQTTVTIDEVRNIVEQSLLKAKTVAEQARHTQEVSKDGQQAVIDTVDSMTQIKDKVESIAENILALSEKTQQIGEITSTVTEIAAQSNLLALNASVEAARAGEHGRGFAVVAAEVRNLAEQSKQATEQVKVILNEIQRATNMAVMATEEGTKGADSGVQRASRTGQTIQQMSLVISENANSAQQMVASAQQQTTGMEQIALAMQNINQVSIQSLTSIRQAEKAAQDLADLARQMEGLVSQYKLKY